MCWKNFMIWNKKCKIPIRIYSMYKTMLSSCLKCRNNTENKNPIVVNTENWRIILLPSCAVCNSKNRNFLKNK